MEQPPQPPTGTFGALGAYVSSALDFNKATLSGALDIIAVRHDDGTIVCTPFHVRFGKFKVFRSRDRYVSVAVNGIKSELVLQLGEAGEAFFLHPAGPTPPPPEPATAPPTPSATRAHSTCFASSFFAASSSLQRPVPDKSYWTRGEWPRRPYHLPYPARPHLGHPLHLLVPAHGWRGTRTSRAGRVHPTRSTARPRARHHPLVAAVTSSHCTPFTLWKALLAAPQYQSTRRARQRGRCGSQTGKRLV